MTVLPEHLTEQYRQRLLEDLLLTTFDEQLDSNRENFRGEVIRTVEDSGLGPKVKELAEKVVTDTNSIKKAVERNKLSEQEKRKFADAAGETVKRILKQ